jgi:hypothetical protein
VQSGREEIVQASDTFLLQLEFDAGQVVDMAPIVDAYKQLPVIIYAEYVTRQK